MAALAEAIAQYEEEGGQPARLARYTSNCPALVQGMQALGFLRYPGKLTQIETFRVGCIGAIGTHAIEQAVHATGQALGRMQ